jgi:hypothetical protein
LTFEDLQLTSCTRCKNAIFGNPKGHLEICEKLGRLDDTLEELSGDGYDSLTFEQIGLLVDFLLKTDLSGYIIADVISDRTKPLVEEDCEDRPIESIKCPKCGDMITNLKDHPCLGEGK